MDSIKKYLRSQFGNPRGNVGKLAGWIMAHRHSNRERNLWTLQLLEIQPTDKILEIGFGPGFALEKASELATKGWVLGLDHSEEMLKMAFKRNQVSIEKNLMALRMGSIENPPIKKEEQFNKIYSVNSFFFWANPEQCLETCFNLLKENGRIAITHQPRSRKAVDEDAVADGKEIECVLREAGFRALHMHIKKMLPVSAVCVEGRK